MADHDGPPTDGTTDPDPFGDDPSDALLTSLDEDEATGDVEPPLLPRREPLHSIFRALGVVEQIVGSILLLMIMVLVLVQVLSRYVHGTWPWTGELARYCMVWSAFLLAGYLIAYAPHHIAIHVVDFVAKGRWLALDKLFVNLVVLATSLVLLYGTYTLIADDIGQVTPAGGMPLRYVNMVPLVGLTLVAIRCVMGIVIRDVPALISGEEVVE